MFQGEGAELKTTAYTLACVSLSLASADQKVRALPTFIFFKNGKRVGETAGAKTKSVRKMIDALK